MITQPVPLYQQAYEAIKKSILSGKYKPGSNILMSQLIEEYQISRTPLKEALRKLQNEGLVELHSMGTKVIQLKRNDITELCYCRLILEKEMINLVIDEINEEDLKAIEEVLNHAEKFAQEDKNIETSLEYNSKFHEIIMNACPNKTLLQLLESIRNKLLLYRAISILEKEDQLKIINQHREIYNALKLKDKAKAIDAIEIHLKSDQERYYKVVEE